MLKMNGNSISESSENNHLDDCASCGGKSAKFICSRCTRISYCSTECQHKDFENHVKICLPMPYLVPMNSSDELSSMLEDLSTKALCIVNLYASASKTVREQVKELMKRIDGDENESIKQNGQAKKTSRNEHIAGANQHRSSKNLKVQTIKISNMSQVLLTTFHSSNRCIVCPSTNEKQKERKEIIDQVEEFGRDAVPLNKKPKDRSYALAKYENGKLARVQITATKHETNIRVFFIDYGKYDIKKITQLYVMPESLYSLPQYMVCVQLHNLPNVLRNENIKKLQEAFTKEEYELEYCDNDDNVTLYDVKTRDNLNKRLLHLYEHENLEAYSKNPDKTVDSSKKGDSANQRLSPNRSKTEESPKKMVKPSKPEVEPVMEAPFETVLLKKGDKNIKVVVMDISNLEYGVFSCIPQANIPDFKVVYEYLNPIKDNEPYTPRLHEYCVALYKGEWYRAKVIEVVDAKNVTVEYVDYRNESNVNVEDIRRYPISLRQTCYSNLCALTGVPEDLNKQQQFFLCKNVRDQDILHIDRIEEVDVEENSVCVYCEDIIDKMKQEGVL